MDKHYLRMALGVMTGMGTSFLVMGIISIFRLMILSNDKLKQIEIEEQDERNMQIKGKVHTVSYYFFLFILVFMIFTFLLLNYMVPAFVCVGALYMQIIVVYLAKRYFDKRM